MTIVARLKSETTKLDVEYANISDTELDTMSMYACSNVLTLTASSTQKTHYQSCVDRFTHLRYSRVQIVPGFLGE